MREDLDKSLCEKYPEIFRNRNAPVTKNPMGWGVECGDGWYDLIDVLCRNIQHHVDWNHLGRDEQTSPDKLEQPVAAQVKEKFGGLRFYLDGGDDTICGMVKMAESMSYRICEECGNIGRARGGGWVRTLCDEHAAKYDNEIISSSGQLSFSF